MDIQECIYFICLFIYLLQLLVFASSIEGLRNDSQRNDLVNEAPVRKQCIH